MREIKFRGYDEQQKIMHLDFEFISSGQEHNDWIIFKSDKQQLKNKVVFDNPYFYKQFKIMQYTGYKDKNGKDIYCNDIIINTFLDKQIFLPDTIMECAINGFYNYNESTYIVIGNIYENPELLSK